MLKRALLAVAAMLLIGAAFLPGSASASLFGGPAVTLSKSVVKAPEQVRWYRYYRRHYRWRRYYRVRHYYWRPRIRYYRRHHHRRYYRWRW